MLGLTYINYAGLAPLRGQAWWAGLLAPELVGNTRLPKVFKNAHLLREQIARWLGCEPRQVAFVPSTSMALTLASNVLPWQVGDTVYYYSEDFPANQLPWHFAAKRFGIHAVPVTNWQAWLQDEDKLPAKMVSLSTVDYTSGIELPWQAVVKHAREEGMWTVVDAIQSAGVKPSWIPEIDFWCAGVQKWLVSGLGLAILVVSDRVLAELENPFPSYLALNHMTDIGGGFTSCARKFELGWVSPSLLQRLSQNLKHFEKMGWEEISQAVKTRRDVVHEALLEMNVPILSCPKAWSGIVTFNPGSPEKAKTIVEAGYKERIILAERNGYVRLSPHVFNTVEEIKRTLHFLLHAM